MKAILNTFGILAILAGFYYGFQAFTATLAPQGSYYANMATMFFVFALCCVVGAGQSKNAND